MFLNEGDQNDNCSKNREYITCDPYGLDMAEFVRENPGRVQQNEEGTDPYQNVERAICFRARQL